MGGSIEMNDDGVAPVVALMLILAVVVTLVSVFASTYVPSLKDESEIYHLDQVKESFIGFSSHVENSAMLKTDGSLVSSVPLGGGEITINQQKSGGILKVSDDQEIYTLRIRNFDDNNNWIESYPSLINFSYQTVNNYWKDQSLVWQFGYTNISENDRTTPLEFGSMEDVAEYIRDDSSFPASLINLDCTYENEPVFTLGVFDGYHHNLTRMDITIVHFQSNGMNAASGNGVGKLKLNSKVETVVPFNSTRIVFRMDNDKLPEWFKEPVWIKVENTFDQIDEIHPYNLDNLLKNSNRLRIDFLNPGVPVNLKWVNITVSVN